MSVLSQTKTERIRELNDKARQTFTGCVLTLTQGVDALCTEVKAEVLRRVREFNRFDTDNDPYHEHDFGAFNIGPAKFFFKWDYYDRTLEAGSEDPADPSKTTRVLTVMLADEY